MFSIKPLLLRVTIMVAIQQPGESSLPLLGLPLGPEGLAVTPGPLPSHICVIHAPTGRELLGGRGAKGRPSHSKVQEENA